MDPKTYARQVIAAVQLNAQRLAIQFETSSERFVKAITVAYLSGATQTAAFMSRNDGAVTSQQIEKGLTEAGHMLGFELLRPNEAHNINPAPEQPAQEPTADLFRHWPRPWRAEPETLGNIEAANGEPVVQVQPLSPKYESNIEARHAYRRQIANLITTAVNAYATGPQEPTGGKTQGSAAAALHALIHKEGTTPAMLADFAAQLARETDAHRAAADFKPDAATIQKFAERHALEDCRLSDLCLLIDDARTLHQL